MFDYRYSTGLEALIGYLYLTGKSTRLSEIFGMIADKLKNIENNVR
jgi:ribonuclease-3 family protein